MPESSVTTRSQSVTGSPSLAAAQSSLAPADPKQVFRINVTSTGDATWTIQSRFLLTTEEEEAAFAEYADAISSGKRDATYDMQQFETFRQDAQTETNREMRLENAGWDEPRIVSPEEAGIESTAQQTDGDSEVRVGVISYSFTWTNFATVDEDRIYFGDAFQTDTGVWMSLTDGQRLVIESPSGYALETPTTLKWDGPHQFTGDELEIVFVRSAGNGFVFGISKWMVAAVLGFVVVGTGGYFLARRAPSIDLPPPLDHFVERLAGLPIVAHLGRIYSRVFARSGRGDSDALSTTDTDGGTFQSTHESATAPGGPDTTAPSGTELEFEEIDPELLSDEERVHRMLKRNGGRMKQASIVKETGWSNAKVSQLLSQMDDDGEIEKLRIGRENLITLPDVDPTEVN
ncbi:helix-turn-helix transcriptional regulator [Halosolutus halophilus]|uniref:helix-turn-helix transcriptional regulator n=1 Tax=Halosolutus halophilus TaxID=1552990 RepID=UPI003CE58E6C